jgi:hypothetical protein
MKKKKKTPKVKENTAPEKEKNKNPQEKNLLTLIPVHQVDYELTETGGVVLLIPKFRGKILGKYLQPRLSRPYFRLSLDAIGSFFWQQCDGHKDVQEIAKIMQGHFGEKVEPLIDRLNLFILQLDRGKAILLRDRETDNR